jgi:O-antigen ligase
MTVLVSLMFALILLLTSLLVASNASIIFYALLVFLPINTLLPEGIPYRESQGVVRFAAFAGILAYCVLRRLSFRKELLGDRLSRLLLVWLGSITLSLILSAHFSEWAERTLIRMASYFALYFVFRLWLRTPKQFANTMFAISAVILMCSLFAIVQVVYGGYTPLYSFVHNDPPYGDWLGRPPSFIASGTNSFGGFMGLLMPFEIAGLVLSRKRSAARSLHWVTFTLGLVAVILTGSRGAAISVAVSCVLAMFYFMRQKRTRIAMIAALVIVLPILAVVAEVLAPRLTHIDQQESVGERYLIWAEAWGIFVQHPVMGIGMGNFRDTYDPNAIGEEPGQVDTHNLYLQLLTETGVVGFIVFLVLAGHVLRRNIRNLRAFPYDSVGYASSFAALGAMLSVLIHGMVDFLFIGSTEFGAAFAVTLAISAAVDHRIWAMQPVPDRRIQKHRALDGIVALGRSMT